MCVERSMYTCMEVYVNAYVWMPSIGINVKVVYKWVGMFKEYVYMHGRVCECTCVDAKCMNKCGFCA